MSTTADTGSSSGAAASSMGLLEDARSLWQEVSELAHDQLSLAALETRLAGESLVIMIVAGVMIAVLLVSAWLGLMASAIMVLVGTGVTAHLAVLIGVGTNALVALILFMVVRRKSRHLQWAASTRSLSSASGARTGSESADASP